MPWLEIGERGPHLLFLHANAYPPRCYRPLLEELALEYRVSAMEQRPLWPQAAPSTMRSWHVLSDDLMHFMEELGLSQVTAIGHSMGAIAALRAAIRHPERFRALVLLEPVLVLPWMAFMWKWARSLGVGELLQPRIRRTLKRRRRFDGQSSMFSAYRPHGVFRHLSDEALRTVIAGLTPAGIHGLLDLIYSPEWEAQIYQTAAWNDQDLWAGIPQLGIPTLILRGSESDTLHAATLARIQSMNAEIATETVPQSSHLLPLERPITVATLASRFLANWPLTQAKSMASAVPVQTRGANGA